MLKRIARKKMAWGEVFGDVRLLAVYIAAAFGAVIAAKDYIAKFLGLQ